MVDDKEIKITKEAYREYLYSLFQNITEVDEFNKKALESFMYLTKNYMNLTDDMQEVADKIIDESVSMFDSEIQKLPDTADTRKAKRLFRALKNKYPGALSLLSVLESKPEIDNEIVKETQRLYYKYFQLYMDFFYDIILEGSHRGHAAFAKLSMLFSSIDELAVSLHLAQHGFANQAYAHVRTVFENIHKLELFIQDESFAELWCVGDEKIKKKVFKPVEVRKKIGIDKDPLYSFFSSLGAHVTWDYMQSKSAKNIKEPGEKPEILLFLSGTRRMPHIIMANVGCIIVLFLVCVYLKKALPDRVNDEDYNEMIVGFTKDFVDYIAKHIEFFKGAALDTSELEQFMEQLARQVQDIP